ncbi:hypothetical protein N3K66_008531 [Trichothecium roseum]|uniref:Uncharacterized protein n=1 Tax=Trichothecium roseum TaxID=47278 RepID=A0ACC0UQG1_9HYPO|nr:hypothetical protein N3K66_008531 [Trichothecium roseum]
MRVVSLFAALLGSAASVSALAVRGPNTTPDGYLKVYPGGIKDLIVSEETTLNGTYKGDEPLVVPPAEVKAASTLPFHFVNNFGSAVNAYMTGTDESGRVAFVRGDGSLYYPSSGGSGTPVGINGDDIKIPLAAGQTLDMTLPISLTSGRVYFAAGDLAFAVVSTPNGEGIVQPAPNNPADPSAGVNWGFVELTLLPNGTIYANISYVDFVGMPLGMKLDVNGGDAQTAYGVSAGAVSAICNDLSNQQGADGRPWGALCMAGSNGPVRALAPTGYTDIDANGFATYWDQYGNDVWGKYTNQDLIIDTQGGAGKVTCRVSGDTLNCNGDNRGYNRPTARDIWGCDSGPFGKQAGDNDVHLAVIPRLCAAFVRTTLLLDGGDTQPNLPGTSYYTADPTNHYSRIVHSHEVDGKGYAFAYDDVNPNGTENASGTVSHGSPSALTVYIGAPP